MLAGRIVLALSCGVLGFGCTDQPNDRPEIIDNLVRAGFPADDIVVVNGVVYVGRDAEVTLAASREMLQITDVGKEQYRTTNLVGAGVTKICVGAPTFTGSFSTALSLAIQNYAAQPLRFSMARAPSTGCSFTINAVIDPGISGGSSGFPSGGTPFPTIKIGAALTSSSLDVIEHVITHELGHSIGFRHTDFFNRSISCGSGGNEGDAGIGAILVPGSPGGAVSGGSVMNSCFDSTESGEFSDSDIAALRTLYTPTQSNWRWCHKCQGLFFAGSHGSHCPAGGAHENVGSGDYHPAHGLPVTDGWQGEWRWCHKCQGMFFGANPGSHCPAGGAHENVGSGDYSFLNDVGPGAGLQEGWRWCSKCQGMFFGSNSGSSHCPAGGAHILTGSGNYSLFNL